jgi:vacuolar-type H+-ATPase subunit I/STV1
MKSKLEADMRASSFVETKNTFDVNAEQEKIKELQRKWEREAMKLGEPSPPSQAEIELNSLIEQQKAKEATAQAELEKLKDKLNKDIEIMHRDMAINTQGVSFLQESDDTLSFFVSESKNMSSGLALRFAKRKPWGF